MTQTAHEYRQALRILENELTELKGLEADKETKETEKKTISAAIALRNKKKDKLEAAIRAAEKQAELQNRK